MQSSTNKTNNQNTKNKTNNQNTKNKTNNQNTKLTKPVRTHYSLCAYSPWGRVVHREPHTPSPYGVPSPHRQSGIHTDLQYIIHTAPHLASRCVYRIVYVDGSDAARCVYMAGWLG